MLSFTDYEIYVLQEEMQFVKERLEELLKQNPDPEYEAGLTVRLTAVNSILSSLD